MNILNLPDHLIASILNKLDLSTLINARLICKKIKSLIDDHQNNNIKIEKLCIFNHNTIISVIKSWLFEPAQFDFHNSIDAKYIYSILISSFFTNFFKNLKELYIYMRPGFFEYDLNVFNQFDKLEILLIKSIVTYKDQILNPPNLKTLIILNNSMEPFYTETKITITIESKIENLTINPSYNIFKIKYPEYIKYLFMFNLGDFRMSCKCSELKNIKILRFMNYRQSDFLLNLKNLEKVHFDGYSDLEKDGNAIIKLKKLNKLKFKFYIHGILITKSIKNYNFNSIEHRLCTRKREKIQLINYKSLDYNLHHLDFKYNNLIYLDKKTIRYSKKILKSIPNFFLKYNNPKIIKKNKLIVKLPSNFFLKFNEIKSVKIKNLKIDYRFIDFLRNCKYLLSLIIINCTINQSTLDELPLISRSLLRLDLNKLINLNNCNFNFNFISKFDYLSYLTIKQELYLKTVLKLFKECKSLHTIRFHLLKKCMHIKRYGLFKFDSLKEKLYERRFFDTLITPLIEGRDYQSEYNKLLSDISQDSNYECDYIFDIKYFNENVSKENLNYEQLIDYFKNIPNLIETELNNGNKMIFCDEFHHCSYLF